MGWNPVLWIALLTPSELASCLCIPSSSIPAALPYHSFIFPLFYSKIYMHNACAISLSFSINDFGLFNENYLVYYNKNILLSSQKLKS